MTSAINESIGDRIKTVRNQRGLTQKELSKALDISDGYLSQLEKGQRNIDADLLYSIAKELRVDITTLYPQLTGAKPLAELGKPAGEMTVGKKHYLIYED